MIDRAELAQMYTEKGMSSPMIAEKLGISPATVCRALREHGLTRHVDRPSPADLLKDITTMGREPTAKKYGVSRSTVANWIRQYRDEGLIPKRISYSYRRQGDVKTDVDNFSEPPPPVKQLVSYMESHTYSETAAYYKTSIVTLWRWVRHYRKRGLMA